MKSSSTLEVPFGGDWMSKVGLLQFDPTVGDLEQNCQRLTSLAHQAQLAGANVGVSTELAVCGYPPRDLLMERDFIQRSMSAALEVSTPMPVLIGTPIPAEDDRTLPTNGVVRSGPESSGITNDDHGRIVAEKQLLPTYDVFDEARYFAAKNRSGLARSFGGMTLGVTVCEDAWQSAGMTPSSYAQDPIEHIAEWCRQGVAINATVNLSASPFHSEKFIRGSPLLATPQPYWTIHFCSPIKSAETTIFSLTAAVLWFGLTVVPSLLHRGRKVCLWLIWTVPRRAVGWRVLLKTPCALGLPK